MSWPQQTADRQRRLILRWTLAIATIAAVTAIAVRWLRDDDVVPSEPSRWGPRDNTSPHGAGAIGHADVALHRIDGQVIDAADEPVAGATVTIVDLEPETTTSGVDGTFAFEQLLPRPYLLAAHKEDLYSSPLRIRVGLHDEPITVRLRRGNRIMIEVVDASDGSPIDGARVVERGWMGQAAVVTGSSGTAVFHGVRIGISAFEATSPGYAPSRVIVSTRAGPGERLERRIALARGAPVAGLVLGPDGRPVTGATVIVVREDRKWDTTLITDQAGQWRLATVEAGGYVLAAASPEYAPSESSVLELDGLNPRSDVVLRLSEGVDVSGVVVDGQGKPVSGPSVYLNRGDVRSRPISADLDGRFLIRGVEDGEFVLVATAAGMASAPERVSVMRAPVRGVRLILSDGLISGHVVDEQGQPVADAKVMARTFAANSDDVTDSHGRFELGPVPPGAYQLVALRAELDAFSPVDEVTAKTGDRNARLVAPGIAEVTGVVTSDGKPVPDYVVVVTKNAAFASNEYGSAVRDRHGRFAVRSSAGTVSIVVAGETFAKHQVDGVVLAADEFTDVGVIEVARGRRLTGRVADQNGSPVAGVRVTAGGLHLTSSDRDADPARRLMSGARTTVTDKEGKFSLIGAEPSRSGLPLEIVAVHGPLRVSKEIGDAENNVELILQSTGAIVGILRGSRGAAVVVANLSGGRRTAVSRVSPTGRFELEGLAPGSYSVVAQVATGQMSQTVSVELKAGPATTVNLELAGDNAITLELVVANCDFLTLQQKDDPNTVPVMRECTPGMSSVVLHGVIPGEYKACTNGGCKQITVNPTPGQQAVDLTSVR